MSGCSATEAEPFFLTPFPFGGIHLFGPLLSAAITTSVSRPFITVSGELGRCHDGIAVGVDLGGYSVPLHVCGDRRKYGGIPTLFFGPLTVGCLKLVYSFEVSYDPFDFLREDIVIPRFCYGRRIYFGGIREGVL